MEKTFQLGLNNKIVDNQWHLVNHIEEFNLIYMTDNNNCSQTEGDLDEVKVLALYSVKVLFTSIVFAICQQEMAINDTRRMLLSADYVPRNFITRFSV